MKPSPNSGRTSKKENRKGHLRFYRKSSSLFQRVQRIVALIHENKNKHAASLLSSFRLEHFKMYVTHPFVYPHDRHNPPTALHFTKNARRSLLLDIFEENETISLS